MPSLMEIIQQIQRDLSCPICGQKYKIGKIRLRGLFDHTLIIQTICTNGHLTFFMTTIKTQKKTPLSTNDIIDLHQLLENFNGDFQKLWKKSF